MCDCWVWFTDVFSTFPEQKQQLGEQPEFSLFNHIEPGHPPMPPPAAPWVYPGMGGRSSASPGPRATPTKPSGPRVHNMPPFAQSPLVPHPNPYMAAAAATPHMAYLWHSMQQQAQQPVAPRARAPKVNLQASTRTAFLGYTRVKWYLLKSNDSSCLPVWNTWNTDYFF